MIRFIEHRVADRRILHLIQKWLKAGVMEEGKWSDTETGTPQGSVIRYGNDSRENGSFGKLADHLLEMRLSNDIGF